MSRPASASLCKLLFIALLPILSPTLARGQSSSALINEALDKQFKLDVKENTPLPQVIEAITRDTGVPITATPEVWELLPWGEQTGLKATIENQTLREALQVITRPLGLTFELTDQTVELRPVPALHRLGRRSTVQELAVLDLLARTPAGLSEDHPTVTALLKVVDEKLAAAKSPFAIENRAFDGKLGGGGTTVTVARNATLMESLEAIPLQTSATWYPWGKTLVVIPKQDQVRNQLSRTISVRYNGAELNQVLGELAASAGVPFILEPGAVQKVAPEYRVVRLILDNVTIQQALENIGAVTGLSFTITDKGVQVWAPQGAAATAPTQREPIYGLLPLDNGMEVLIPQSQVPEDLREYLKSKVSRKFDAIREQMKEEGFTPPPPAPAPAATQPASAPHGEDL